ncbi:hypothetical protein AAP_04624 [Ascosphaera apis ARSEF 7405]|uniref:Uncharacterized protein n=1 Tax=Ascosphaera apis ARSEF 7405 TaxID=392613 RepID=A0A167WGX3_9EURO|nr:hypothetical protein AAP_04624 [Ascosphaera apis ARSEF 7405]
MKLNSVLTVTAVFAASAAAAPAPAPGIWVEGIFYDGHQPIPTYVDLSHASQRKRDDVGVTPLPLTTPPPVRREQIDTPTTTYDYTGLMSELAEDQKLHRRDDDDGGRPTAVKTMDSAALAAEISAWQALWPHRRVRDVTVTNGPDKRMVIHKTYFSYGHPGEPHVSTYTFPRRDGFEVSATPTAVPAKRDIEDDQLAKRGWANPTGLPPKRDVADDVVARGWADPTGLPPKRDVDGEVVARGWADPTGLPPKRDVDGEVVARGWANPTGLPPKRSVDDEGEINPRGWANPTGLPPKRDVDDEGDEEMKDVDGEVVARGWANPTGLPPKRSVDDEGEINPRGWANPTGLPPKRDVDDEGDVVPRGWANPTGLPPKRDVNDDEGKVARSDPTPIFSPEARSEEYEYGAGPDDPIVTRDEKDGGLLGNLLDASIDVDI